MNMMLDKDADFKDFGREQVTNLASDRATFLMPSLRNVAQRTAPYKTMDDSKPWKKS